MGGFTGRRTPHGNSRQPANRISRLEKLESCASKHRDPDSQPCGGASQVAVL
jgi:hypothetical protein